MYHQPRRPYGPRRRPRYEADRYILESLVGESLDYLSIRASRCG